MESDRNALLDKLAQVAIDGELGGQTMVWLSIHPVGRSGFGGQFGKRQSARLQRQGPGLWCTPEKSWDAPLSLIPRRGVKTIGIGYSLTPAGLVRDTGERVYLTPNPVQEIKVSFGLKVMI